MSYRSVCAVLVCLFLLASCASVSTMNREASTWIGRPLVEMVAVLGPPSEREAYEGMTVSSWFSEGGSSAKFGGFGGEYSFSGGVHDSGTRVCRLNVLATSEGIISKVTYRVENDTLLGKGRRTCSTFRDALAT